VVDLGVDVVDRAIDEAAELHFAAQEFV
jgi:hypothetical protein